MSLNNILCVQNIITGKVADEDNLPDRKYTEHLSTLKEVNIYNPGRKNALSIRIPFGIITDPEE